jgi:hypothetical protein
MLLAEGWGLALKEAKASLVWDYCCNEFRIFVEHFLSIGD